MSNEYGARDYSEGQVIQDRITRENMELDRPWEQFQQGRRMEQYYEAMADAIRKEREEENARQRVAGKFELISEKVNDEAYGVLLPTRATKQSAGYDLVTPIGIKLQPGESVVVPTYLKCKISSGWFLALYPKSGLGFKYKTRLANTVGIVDGDYYNNESNEGHIMVKVCNEGDKELIVDKGQKFCQAIFMQYGITENDEADGERVGGFGSTGK